MEYRNNDILIYPAIPLATYPTQQLSSDHDQQQVSSRKEYRKDMLSAVSSPKVNFCRPVGSKFIFLQCKKPFPHAPRCGNGGCSRWSQSVNLGRFAGEKIGERKRDGRKNTQAWPSEKSHHTEHFARGTDNPHRTFGD